MNNKNFVIYTKNGCPYCDKIKAVVSKKGANYTEYVLGEHFTKEQFYSEFGDAATFPQVVYDDLKLGGCTESVHYFRAMGWI
jgi:glutaredoxin 3